MCRLLKLMTIWEWVLSFSIFPILIFDINFYIVSTVQETLFWVRIRNLNISALESQFFGQFCVMNNDGFSQLLLSQFRVDCQNMQNLYRVWLKFFEIYFPFVIELFVQIFHDVNSVLKMRRGTYEFVLLVLNGIVKVLGKQTSYEFPSVFINRDCAMAYF